ncbi:hypothetical protein ACJX0J_022687, partial [Zea mays]
YNFYVKKNITLVMVEMGKKEGGLQIRLDHALGMSLEGAISHKLGTRKNEEDYLLREIKLVSELKMKKT